MKNKVTILEVHIRNLEAKMLTRSVHGTLGFTSNEWPRMQKHVKILKEKVEILKNRMGG